MIAHDKMGDAQFSQQADDVCWLSHLDMLFRVLSASSFARAVLECTRCAWEVSHELYS